MGGGPRYSSLAFTSIHKMHLLEIASIVEMFVLDCIAHRKIRVLEKLSHVQMGFDASRGARKLNKLDKLNKTHCQIEQYVNSTNSCTYIDLCVYIYIYSVW